MNINFLPAFTYTLFLILLLGTANLSAQCSPDVTPPVLDCKIDLTVSIHIDGNAKISYLNTSNTLPWDECDGDSLDLNYVFQLNNETPSADFLRVYCEDVGQHTLTMWVSDQSGNTDSCTINLTVEDNLDPVINCLSNATFDLPASGQLTVTPEDFDFWSGDNCDPMLKIHLPGGPLQDSIVLDCTNLGSNVMVLTHVDSIYHCFTDFILRDTFGTCNSVPHCSVDTIPPTLLCHTAVTLSLGVFGTGKFDFINATSQDPWDICDGFNLNYLYQLNNETPADSLIVDCDDIGLNSVTMWVSDQSGNTDSCTVNLEVEDKLDPVIICKSNVSLNLPQSGEITIYPEDFDLGSWDNCAGNLDLQIQLDGGVRADSIILNCADKGVHIITLSNINFINQCFSELILNDPFAYCPGDPQCVNDTIPPELFCKPSSTVALSSLGTAIIYPNNLTTVTPWDGCDEFTINLLYQINNETPGSPPLNFDCSHIGQNMVKIWASDQSGNTDSCTVEVIVQDLLNPVLVCDADGTFDLSASGQITLFPSDFDDGSWDNCGDLELKIQLDGGPQLDSITLDCSYLGNHIMRLGDADSTNFCQTSFLLNDPLNACTPISISGKIFADTISNCILDNGEAGMNAITVEILDLQTNAVHQTLSDPQGNYSFTLFTNPGGGDRSYELRLPDLPGTILLCGSIQTLTIPANETSGVLDFPVFLHPSCSLLTVDITTPVLRRCFTTTYQVSYCNYSTSLVEDPFVEVTFDDLIEVSNSSIPWISVIGNTYHFELPDLESAECGSFNVTVRVKCEAQLQQTLCAEATIEPYENCNPTLGAWSGAEIVAESFCNGTEAGFILRNIGTGNMIETADYVIVEDMVMYMNNPFQLDMGDSLSIMVPVSGATWRIEADQEIGHPGEAQPIAWLEGCGGINTPGLVTVFPTNINNPNTSVFCLEVTGSYDPNDKQGFPKGREEEHFIAANVAIDYLIRFQNTGNDTAFTVVLLDTLDQHLNFSSIRPGASSHPYAFEISEAGILTFTFDNILLPDSIVNEPASHGFVKFRINQKNDLPEGTRIENRAGIYFDFNEVVLTNTTWHTIQFEAIVSDLSKPSDKLFQIRTNPNPFNKEVNFLINGTLIKDGQLSLFDLTGRNILTQSFSGNQMTLNRNHLPAGIYLYKIHNGQQKIGQGKLIAQ